MRSCTSTRWTRTPVSTRRHSIRLTMKPAFFTYKDTSVITPNSDTPYSILWTDLRAEPIVLSVPAVEKSRYYSVMLCHGNTYNYGYIANRATGSGAPDYILPAPHLKAETPPP